MITQIELAELGELQDSKKKLVSMTKSIKEKHLAGEGIEPGILTLIVDKADSTSVSYKEVLDRIRELHPELAGPIERWVRDNTKPTTRYELKVRPTNFIAVVNGCNGKQPVQGS